MSESIGEWEDRQRRSALRSYEKVVGAIERGEPDEARSIMAASLAAALRHWERTAPDQLKQPVAWMASDR
jgi:DNA-binding FadR family transcriptional regulator